MSNWTVIKTEDGSRSLFSALHQQACHSLSGALQETRYVSVELSGVAQRLTSLQPTRVLEIGLGTGLGLLLTAKLAREAGCELEFVSIERDLLSASTLRDLAYDDLLGDAILVDRFADALAAFIGEPVIRVRLDERTQLEVRAGDATGLHLEPSSYDACYLDAFSPQVNPELWSEAFLARVVAALRPGARLSSYCVQGAIRRRLQHLGMRVEKRAGIGKKREVLVATKPLADIP